MAIEPSPKLVLAEDAVDAPVPPSAIAISVISVIEPPVIFISSESCVAIEPSPKVDLAEVAFVAPVPPKAIGTIPAVISCPEIVR